MKKLIFTTALFGFCFIALQAQENYYICKSGGTMQTINIEQTNEFTFGSNGNAVNFALKDGAVCGFAVNDIDSIAFTAPAGRTLLTYSNDFDVTFDASDATSYNEVPEVITTVETETNDYNDFFENYTVGSTITITYNGNSASYTGSATNVSVTISGANVTVKSAKKKMKYVLKGTSENGSFKIYSDYKYAVEMNNLTLTNPTGPAINIQSGKTVYMLLANGTTNTLCDGATYAAAPVTAGKTEGQKGTLFSEGQLIFSGTGTLNVTSFYGHAICSDDYIRVRSGNINVLAAVKDGFNTNDHFLMYGGTLTINSSDDGIDCGKGHVDLNGGKIIINSVDEGITASYDSTDAAITPYLNLNGGYLNITTSGEKGMGLKATGNINISGGTAQITVAGDGSKGVNTDANLIMTGGKITVLTTGSVNSEGSSAGGFKSEGTFTLNGGIISVKSSGKGSKGINTTGNFIMGGGEATLISQGENYKSSTLGDSRSRALTCDGSITMNAGTLKACAYDNAIHSLTNLSVANGTVQAYSQNSDACKVSGSYTQSGGWVVLGKK